VAEPLGKPVSSVLDSGFFVSCSQFVATLAFEVCEQGVELIGGVPLHTGQHV
jgi:hypothetical protein